MSWGLELNLGPIELYWAVAAELTVFLGVASLVMAQALLFARRWTRLQAPLGEARAELARQLTAEQFQPEELEQRLRALPKDALLEELAGLAVNLRGESQERLRSLAAGLGFVPRALEACRDRRWWVRLEAVRLLAVLGTGHDTVPALLDDPHPLVRAEAVGWVAEHPEQNRIERLVGMLNEPSAAARFAVADALLRLGSSTIEPLARRLASPRGENVETLRVAAGMAAPRFLESGLALSSASLAPVRAAAARLLGALGGESATGRLRELLADPDPEVRGSAASGLGALGFWEAAADLTALLEDEAFLVRLAVARSLRSMGDPGALLLRRASRGDTPGAAVARHVLQLPESLLKGDRA